MPDERVEDRGTSSARDSVDFSGFGLKLRASGKQVGGVLSVIALAVLAGWIAYFHDQKATSTLMLMEEMVYVISLPQIERDKLNLAMPVSLREKVLKAGPK